jgi:LysM repeat protein
MKLKYKGLVIIACFLNIGCNLNAAPNQEFYRQHIVSKGETVYSISRTYNVSVAEIYTLNPQAEKGLRAGDTLKLSAEKTTVKEQQYIWHSIQARETLYSVSKQYNVSKKDIVAANEGLTADNFRIGRVVRIPKVSSAAVKPVEPAASAGYVIYKVQSKETLPAISRRHNVTIEQLAALNPELSESGLKKDMNLRIPAGKENSNTPSATSLKNEISSEPSGLSYQMVAEDLDDVIKVGLLLPFLESQEYQQAKFVEYYEGFLLAVEEMKSKGYSIDLYVFDTKKGLGVSKLKSLLDTYEFRNLDFIIGGVSDDEILLLSEFTKENNIGYAVPFPAKNEQTVKNPETFLSNVSSAFLYPKVANSFVKQFSENNVILLIDENDEYNDKKEFVALLKSKMEKQAVINQTLLVNAKLSQNLKPSMLLSKKNVLVPASSSLMSLSKIIPVVRMLKQQDPSLDISLFGYPDWQTYSAQFLEDFFNYDTYIFSSFYVDNTGLAAQQFMNKYQSWYGKTLLNIYPKYGILGYDTGLYFLTALAGNRKFYEDYTFSIKMPPAIQSAFHFDRSNNTSNVNTGFYFVHYKKDMTIEKNDYSK